MIHYIKPKTEWINRLDDVVTVVDVINGIVYYHFNDSPLNMLALVTDDFVNAFTQVTPSFEVTSNDRGFRHYNFLDAYGSECRLAQSSAVKPHIWLGVSKLKPKLFVNGEWVNYAVNEDVLFNSEMHLNREQVKAMLPYLIQFAEHGEINHGLV